MRVSGSRFTIDAETLLDAIVSACLRIFAHENHLIFQLLYKSPTDASQTDDGISHAWVSGDTDRDVRRYSPPPNPRTWERKGPPALKKAGHATNRTRDRDLTLK